MPKILVIGDTSEYTKNYANSISASAELVGDHNFSEVVALPGGVFFSALGDLDFGNLKLLALTCDEIKIPDNLLGSIDNTLTSTLINHLSHFKPILPWARPLPGTQTTVDTARQYSEPTLWTFGCSHTAGIGLDNPAVECYGHLLAEQLNMPWQNVSKPGSSTMWSLTHLLNADIRPDDVVVWATTSPDRDRVAQDNKVIELRMQNMSRDMMGYLTDEQIAFRHVFNVNCGVQYLRALETNFIFFSLLPESNYNHYFETQFSLYKEWCPTIDWFLDIGNDQAHSGPKTHQHLANLAHSHLKLLKTN
jgi:hypothetical protein